MKLKTDNESGLGHIIAPILVVMLVVVVGVTLNVVTSAQSKVNTKKAPRRYSPSEKKAFAIAAAAYWGNPQREDQASHAQKKLLSLKDKETTCQPKNVRIDYYNDPKDDAIAYTHLYAARKQKINKKSSRAQKADAKDFNKRIYCRMWFNDAYSGDIRYPGYACATFIHEYGHMLGRDHNTNPHSPMYVGYINKYGVSQERFDKNTLDTISKSLCYLGDGQAIK